MKTLLLSSFSLYIAATPYTLQQAQDFALKNNKRIKAAYDLLEAARSSKSASHLQWIFKIDANAAIKKYEFPIQSPFIARGNYTAGLLITQNIFNMGLAQENRLSALALQLAKITLDAVMLDTLFQLRTIYYKILLDYHLISTIKHHIELLSQVMTNTQKKYDVGEVSLFALNQSKVFLQNSYPALNKAYKDLKSDLNQFAQILGVNPSNHFIDIPFAEIPIDLVYKIDEKMKLIEQTFKQSQIPYQFSIQAFQLTHLYSNEEIEYWLNIAIECRPDYNEAKINVNIARQNVKLNLSKFFPLVQGFAELQSPEVNQLNQIHLDWALGINLNWRLFSGFSRLKELQSSRYQEKAATEKLKFAYQTLNVDIHNQIYTMEEEMSSYQSAIYSFDLAQVAANQALERYKVGMISIIDCNQVIDSMLEAEFAMHKARFNLLSSYFALRHASGIDLKIISLTD